MSTIMGIVIGVGSHIFIKHKLGHEWGTKKYWLWFLPSVIVLNSIVSTVLNHFAHVVHR